MDTALLEGDLLTERNGSPVPKPFSRKRTRKPRLLYRVSCSAVGGSVLAGTQVDVKELAGGEGGKGEEGGQAWGGGPAAQATGAPGPGHISVRMSMRLFRPER